ncbi:MAG: flavodoxin family protein [Peptococcaceae bacterium]|nr:flavodoxin family protein [Peptococcaceae bacterium]
MVKILGLSGSPRAGGNTDVLLNQFLKGAEAEGAQTEKIYLRDYVIQPCIGCERCRKDKTCTRLFDGMQLLYPKVEEAQGLILGSPAHNLNVTAWVKAFIDRLYPYYNFTDDRPRKYSSRLAGQGRKAIVYGVCEQNSHEEGMGFTLSAMREPLRFLGYEVIKEFSVAGIFDRGAVREDKEILKAAFEDGRRLAQAIGK